MLPPAHRPPYPVRPRPPAPRPSAPLRSASPRSTPSPGASPRDARPSPRAARRLAALGLAIGASFALLPGRVAAFDAPTSPPEGWDAKVQFGAEATTGASRTSSLSFESGLSWHVGRLETAARARVLRSEASVEVVREENGEPVLRADGEPVTDVVDDRTNDRLAFGVEPRWYLAGERRYLFGLLDYDTNPPAGVDRSTRQVAGVGYRLWNDKDNFLAAGIGVGHKRFEATDGETSDGGIGYFGVKIVLKLSEKAKLDAGLDTDFGGDSESTEFGVALGYRIADPVSLKLGYDARVRGGVADDDSSAFDESLDGRASLKLEVDLF